MNLNKIFKPSKINFGFYSACLSKKKYFEWILVLEAMDIPFESGANSDFYELMISEADRDRAFIQIALYERENRKKRIQEKKIYKRGNESFVIFTPFFLYLFYFLVLLLGPKLPIVSLGDASAEAILAGEWWRTITALTLHADISHLFSNLIFGGILATLVIRQTGSGLGWLLILFSGILGDYWNSLLYVKNHHSIGASTAIFGAVGVLSSLQFYRQYRFTAQKAWVALGCGLAFLAFLGAGGQNTDLSAHFFGFFAGIFWGSLAGFFLKGRKVDPSVNIFLLLFCLGAVLFSWFMALRNHM